MNKREYAASIFGVFCLCLVAAFCSSCKNAEPTQPEAAKPLQFGSLRRLTAKIGGSADATTLKLSDVPDDHPPQRLIYMKIGNKVILPQWFTLGLDAQKLPVKSLPDAWEKRTPGVYRCDYSAPEVRDVIFKGLKVEVSE